MTLAGCAIETRRMQQPTIDKLMSQYNGAVPGASVLIVKDSVAIVRRGYGLASAEDDIAATQATNYRLASVTKQFTAAAILSLAEDGRLGLNDRARTWLPSLPITSDAVTICFTRLQGSCESA